MIFRYNLSVYSFKLIKYTQHDLDLKASLNYKLQKLASIFAIMLLIIAIINGLSGIPFIHAQQASGSGSPVVFPPDSRPYGLTYSEWTAKWWEWAFLMPEADNPSIDDTGKNCAINQTGPVWFLAGTFGGAVTRECTIPSDKGILVPLVNVACDSATEPSLDTEAELRSCAKADQDTVIAKEITVDGVNIGNLDSYRFQSPLFNLTLPENNIAGVAPQTAKAVSDGYWILIEPLSLGSHEIHFKAALGDPTAIGTTNFALDVRYLLTVVGGATGTSPTENVTNQSISLQGSTTAENLTLN
jgi:hypothetical protein